MLVRVHNVPSMFTETMFLEFLEFLGISFQNVSLIKEYSKLSNDKVLNDGIGTPSLQDKQELQPIDLNDTISAF